MQNHLYSYDLPEEFEPGDSIAIDTEAMGLMYHRDRLCLVQISSGDGHCHLVHFPKAQFDDSIVLKRILSDSRIKKIFHYGRFDIASLIKSFSVEISNVYCTKIASHLCRTYTDRHSLKNLCEDLLKLSLDKENQTSDWGSPVLSSEQINYAASDVLHLHALKEKLDNMLVRENRMELAQKCFDFLPTLAKIDLMTSCEYNVFAHKI